MGSMRVRWIVILALLLSIVVRAGAANAQETQDPERTWISTDGHSAVLSVTVFDLTNAGFLADATVMLAAGAIVDGLEKSGVPESAIHVAPIGDADRSEKLIVTVTQQANDGMPAVMGLTSIRSGDYVQLVVAGSNVLTESELRDRLLDLADRVPETALTADELLLADVDVSTTFGVEMRETTLDELGTPEAG